MKKVLFGLFISASMFANNIVVENPYVKITPPNTKNSAIFMKINNNSNEEVKLIDAKCDYANTTEIHTHINEDGMMKMVKIKDIVIPANNSVELKPKSYHIMLMDIKQSIDENTKVNLELNFSNGEKVELKDIPSKEIMHKHH
ncbi:copper chaperone PCu(A)C [Campylobacter sp. MG1]|uniref:copper chaperone PCu(A)C n=1 Tax=Campylobacter sp. MG1 TaxID=2976332 RepID=UPI00226CFC6F|nr:copper chaperone PCu(A)C [Campylobacter sp. MG1]